MAEFIDRGRDVFGNAVRRVDGVDRGRLDRRLAPLCKKAKRQGRTLTDHEKRDVTRELMGNITRRQRSFDFNS